MLDCYCYSVRAELLEFVNCLDIKVQAAVGDG